MIKFFSISEIWPSKNCCTKICQIGGKTANSWFYRSERHVYLVEHAQPVRNNCLKACISGLGRKVTTFDVCLKINFCSTRGLKTPPKTRNIFKNSTILGKSYVFCLQTTGEKNSTCPTVLEKCSNRCF